MIKNYEYYYEKIKANWDAIAKPLDSMGSFEHLISKLGAIQQTEQPSLDRSCVLVLCADNGIVEEGISQSPQSVTRICAENISRGETTVGIMARQTGSQVLAVDIGITEKAPQEADSLVLDYHIRRGTRNFLKEPAMTLEETKQAIEVGKRLVKEQKDKGYQVICIGEMGIGNTTTSAAVAAAILNCPVEEVTGRGAGLSDAGLSHKIEVISQALKKHGLAQKPALEVLQTVGGFDLAGMVGVYLGAREHQLPVILDGAISLVAAMVAEELEPGVVDYLIPSHKSREPLVTKTCERLGLAPVLDAGMALGEGTGAVLFLGNLKTALAVYKDSVVFAESGVEQYERYQ